MCLEPTRQVSPHTNPQDRHTEALKMFKDWNNYLLVTAVAALGWAVGAHPPASLCLKFWIATCLDLSVVFAIFTLALVPLVQEQIYDENSIYDVKTKFWLTKAQRDQLEQRTDIYTGRLPIFWQKGVRLKSVCLVQHLLFMLGILFYLLVLSHPQYWRRLSISDRSAARGCCYATSRVRTIFASRQDT